jgi:hypothetical protein
VKNVYAVTFSVQRHTGNGLIRRVTGNEALKVLAKDGEEAVEKARKSIFSLDKPILEGLTILLRGVEE